ncbi:S-methyl-5-thioribose-1-phosphate isomerase [Prauserella sp. PE36]|uniref:S-methyl-5-thioribose-1-phosphate isomerase n=1 Tax=Prauserella sp. PE36 TaxID=1504709 RepID=UPI000D899297|nr:S-methyl-5-thioribose-1-phosphate isomerase [Prauserella sp. PE36]PXY26030.1 S-methyl-5-thioribose-1-phosphate isomerase [Prauserella coralliicola]RBM15503.1 S-methyl-5-thioribose-1-phosphate isomerase [Prauserella sp. PE36]
MGHVGRTIDWADGTVVIVDQCALPAEHRLLRLATVDELIGAIQRLAVRGAPALGAAGALGVALAAHRHGTDTAAVHADAERLATARPTAVNLRWGVERALAKLSGGTGAVLAEALAMLDEDERVNREASGHAARLLLDTCARRPLRLLTHCNTGRLATVDWGTALGVVRQLHADGQLEYVLADETRPLLQGARLTAWELAEEAIPYRLLPDSAAAAAMARGLVDGVVVGADRIAANGDTANKIGTYGLALAAARHGLPFVVVAPSSTVDASLPDGGAIVIEERAPEEVTHVAGSPVAPKDAPVFNPAFDVTPVDLITAVVTEHGVVAGTAR